MLRFIDREDHTDTQLAKPLWFEQDGKWQVIFECASPDKTRQLDYCREQPPLVLDPALDDTEAFGVRTMTRKEVRDWARRIVSNHAQLNACRIDWF